jgi:hypothetical protein
MFVIRNVCVGTIEHKNTYRLDYKLFKLTFRRSVVRRLVEMYQELYWPFDWDETVLGLRYCLTGILLAAAFLSLVFTFFFGGSATVAAAGVAPGGRGEGEKLL